MLLNCFERVSYIMYAMKDRPLVCVYCGKKTSAEESLEHVVPESLGAKRTLYPGAVCTKCNNDLGSSVDEKVFREGLVGLGQVATGTHGKKGVRTHIPANRGDVERHGQSVHLKGGMSGKGK